MNNGQYQFGNVTVFVGPNNSSGGVDTLQNGEFDWAAFITAPSAQVIGGYTDNGTNFIEQNNEFAAEFPSQFTAFDQMIAYGYNAPSPFVVTTNPPGYPTLVIMDLIDRNPRLTGTPPSPWQTLFYPNPAGSFEGIFYQVVYEPTTVDFSWSNDWYNNGDNGWVIFLTFNSLIPHNPPPLFANTSTTLVQSVILPSSGGGVGGLLPGFAMVGSYSPEGDGALAPSAVAALLSTQVMDDFTVPSTPVFVIYNLTNIAKIQITGDNLVDPPINSGFINTTGQTSGTFEMPNGFTHDITLTFVAYDANNTLIDNQQLPVMYATGAQNGITISPANPFVMQGTNQQFTALAVYADSSTYPLRPGLASWTSSDTENATIGASTGLAAALLAGDGGSTISATYETLSASTDMRIFNEVTAVPTLLSEDGYGLSWVDLAAATATGFGFNQVVSIVDYTVVNGVATFNTAPQSLEAGQPLVLSAFNSSLDGTNVTVLSTGLTTTTFQAAVSLPNQTVINLAANATPSTGYASVTRLDAVTPAPGQSALYIGALPGIPNGYSSGGHNTFGGFNPVYANVATFGGSGMNGTPFAPELTVTGDPLPSSIISLVNGIVGSGTITGIYAYGEAVGVTAAEFDAYNCNWSDGGTSFNFNEFNVANMGSTDPTILTTAAFQHQTLASLEARDPSYFWSTALVGGFEVVYTTGDGPTVDIGQIQNLVGQAFPLTIPSPADIMGLQISFNAGLQNAFAPFTTGDSGTLTLTVQLTLDGTPVGTPKTQTIGQWTTAYQCGGETDLWGLGSLTADQVNESGSPPTNGLGVIISSTNLSNQTQLDFNSLEVTVWYF